MNTKLLLLALVILALSLTEKAWSVPVKISGKAPEYALNSVDLYRYHDFISEEKIILGTIQFNAEGLFRLDIELTETCLCRADFDGYHGMIYLEPGKSYELVFPPKRILSESQKRNPFVKPEAVWLGLGNPVKNELNIQIQQFEQAYSRYENNSFNQIFINRSKSVIDTVKRRLDNEFPETQSSFFESHKLFRKSTLDFALNQGKTAGFMETYFSKTEPCYQLAAYATAFNQVFLNYFNVLTGTMHGAAIKTLMGTSNLQALDDYFQKQLHFNQKLSHWVLLKALNDAYYSKQFSTTSVLKMLDQVKNAGWSDYERKTALLIRSKLTYLSSGTFPPALALKDMNGQKINLSDFPNTYIYLHFTDPKNIICRQHLDALKITAATFKEKLVIIHVIPKTSGFKNDGNWAGIFTTTENDLEKTFKVKTFPTSFLLGKDGKLLLSPAPNPIDGLDRQLAQLFKSDHYKEFEKNNKKNVK